MGVLVLERYCDMILFDVLYIIRVPCTESVLRVFRPFLRAHVLVRICDFER